MEKKFILVGLANHRLGKDFFKAVLDSLESYSIDLTYIDYISLRFETEHTKTWFFFNTDRYQYFQGIRPDAVFGSHSEIFRYQMTSNTFIGKQKGIGLVDYICKVEEDAKFKNQYRYLLNSFYGIMNEEIKPLAKASDTDGLRTHFSAIDEMHTYPCDVDQQTIYAYLGRRNGKTLTCLKYLERELEKKEGEKTMNNAINDMLKTKRAYLVTDNSKVPVHIDNLEISCGELPSFEGHMLSPTMNDIIERRVSNLMSKPTKLPGIKTVHFSGPVTAVIWEDKTKTVVRCNNENIDHEKGLAMAIAKKALGTNKSGSNYYDVFKKWLPEDKEEK